MKSIVQEIGEVPFAAHICERIYMHEFSQRSGLPDELSHWQPTVDAMLAKVDAPGPIYLMVDQGMVRAGVSHRRPGMHIDGYWIPAMQSHGGNGGGGRHCHTPGWDTGGGRWKNAGYVDPEAIILASSVTAARAFAGDFTGEPGEGGDCSHIDTSGMKEIILAAGTAYAGNVTMLHESLPVLEDCLRTVVRLNVPGWSPK